MTSPRTTDRRRRWTALLRLVIAAGTVPLLVAPTCQGGGEGWKTFSQRSLIIPMEVCYQSQNDGSGRTTTYTPASCPGAKDPGSVIKAYGLVYQLIRSNIAVYWVIDQNKTSLTDFDLLVQYNGGVPVQKYNWGTRAPGDALAAPDHIVRYRGGPFVVDGSDYERARQVLISFENTFGPNSGAPVNVHVSNVAFRGWAKKTMAGGWSAGGTVPPKLALLDIASGNATAVDGTGRPTAITDSKNAQPIIAGYLYEAGIGTGTAVGTATGTHGEIYDRLTMADFQPAAGSTDPRTSALFRNGYEILWVPHWVAPGSCSNITGGNATTRNANCVNSVYPKAQIDQALQTIGAFVAEGHDLFAECAGLGSFEGAFKRYNSSTAASNYTIDYQDGDLSTRFQTPLGIRYNELSRPFPGPVFEPGSFGSPLLQLGDFTFTPFTGAVEDYRPQDGTDYLTGVTRLIYGNGTNPRWDYFTVRPRATGSTRGTIVYLAGHSYSGADNTTFQIAGSRLVLNTLFNLGSACTASGVACDTGKLGVCGQGVIQCVNGSPACVQTRNPSAEICDGLDNDCNGLIDDMDTACYTGPSGTNGVGLCHAGVSSCQLVNGTYQMSACNGQVTPTAELCNGLDDNCNNQIDESLSQACYTGPSSSLGADGLPQGTCKAGTQTCTNGSWSACTGQVLPTAEVCPSPLDENCDGSVNEITGEGCGACQPGTSLNGCYTGPSGTANVGKCKTGTQTCQSNGSWSYCTGQITPTIEVCSPASCATDPTGPNCNKDENCNNEIDEGCGCSLGETQSCYDGPAGTQDVGTCRAGHQNCDGGVFTGACLTEILPTPEVCDGLDNDCNTQVDDGATCNAGFLCEHGVCVPDSCNVESPCPIGYTCSGSPARCVRSECSPGVTCADGQRCSYGQCVNQCPTAGQESICWPGAYCQGGDCVGGSCYVTGCDAGEVCQQGTCRPDPCNGLTCPAGTFCRQGDCVQSCVYVSCGSGQKCGADGFCEADSCANKTCGPTQKCEDGTCVEDSCLAKGCGLGQVCKDEMCVDDPCNGVTCPVGQCIDGQCWAVPTPENHGGGQTVGGEGGGCGQGAPSPLSALLLLALLPLARRRRARAVAPVTVALLAVALVATACKGGGEEGQFDPASCTDPNYPACEGENRCVSIWTDTAHCGGCGAACGAGQVCIQKVCAPADAVAPRITGLSPGNGAQGRDEPLTVTISGSRFASGATLRTVSARGTSTVQTVFVDSTRLRADVDLSTSGPETLYVRVVNPDRVISNAVPFDIVTPTPRISNLDPSSVKTGATRTITVNGEGFLPGTECYLSGPGFSADLKITPETTPTDTALQCVVDATNLPPSAGYAIKVGTPTDTSVLYSSPAALTIETREPVLDDVSPNSGEAGAPIDFTLGGSGFDATSVVIWNGDTAHPISTLFVDSGHLYVAQYLLPASGTYTVAVRNGTGPYLTSGTQSFTVGSRPPDVSTVSPGSVYQGSSTTIQVTGINFNVATPTVLQLKAPGGNWVSYAAVVNSTSQVTTSAPVSFSGAAAGEWLVRLCYSSPCGATSPTSATLPFRVLSSQAILQSATPRSAPQGTNPVVVDMVVANLRPLGTGSPNYGVMVKFSGATTPIAPSLVSGTAVRVSLDTRGLQTGTYQLVVANPNGAPDSLPLTFNVTPGVPSLTSVSPTSAAIQDPGTNGTVITLNGANFARPDSTDNGGSSVHVSSGALEITDWPIRSYSNCAVTHPFPWACVSNHNQIQVHLDTRATLAGAYDLEVWNPGGPTPPQRSAKLTSAFTITE